MAPPTSSLGGGANRSATAVTERGDVTDRGDRRNSRWKCRSTCGKGGLSSRRRGISAPITVRPRDSSRCAACACCVRLAGPTVRLIPWCQKNREVSKGDFVCRPQPRPVPETLVCQPASASCARSNYDQVILVETSEKRWRVTQGWHPEKGVRGTAEDHERFGGARCWGGRDASHPPFAISHLVLLLSDINELNLPKTCGTEFPDPDDLLSFKLIICPDEVSKLARSSLRIPAVDVTFIILSGSLDNFQNGQSTTAPINIDRFYIFQRFQGLLTVSGILQRR